MKHAILITLIATAALYGAVEPATPAPDSPAKTAKEDKAAKRKAKAEAKAKPADGDAQTKRAERAAKAKADSQRQTITHRVTGLCSPDRVDDFREIIGGEPELKLISVDFDHAQATFDYIPQNFNATRFKELLGKRGFGINPDPAPLADKLKVVEIGVVGLDCKGCRLGAYEAVNKLNGVEQATVSFKEGIVKAWIDFTKTNRDALEKALTKAKVELREPEKSE